MAQVVGADGLTRSQRWRQRHPEKQAAATSAWAKSERGRRRRAELQAEYRRRHPSRVKAACRAWIEKHPGYERERGRRRFSANPKYNYPARLKYHKTERGRESLKRQAARRKAAMLGIESTLTAKQWEEIKARYDGRCAYCFRVCRRPEIEHVVPVSAGGAHAAHNVVPACRGCNASKRDKPLMAWLFPERLADG